MYPSLASRARALYSELRAIAGIGLSLILLNDYLKEFSQVYENLPLKKKRRLNHALFSAIVSYIKRGENSGEIEIRIRGNGSLKHTWEDIKKRKPGAAGSHTWFPWLRKTHDNSNFLLLRIPIEIANSRKGKKSFSISTRYLPASQAISQDAIARLRQHSLVRELQPEPNINPLD